MKNRSGFSLLELLFVMAILAVLTAIAIPQLKTGKDASTLTSMKSDARNIISSIQRFYSTYDTMPNSSTLVDNDNTGLADSDLNGVSEGDNGYNKISLSSGNSIDIVKGGSTGNSDCYSIEVKNDSISQVLDYDSCTTGKIQTN